MSRISIQRTGPASRTSALANAVLASLDPETGYLNSSMHPEFTLRENYYWHGEHAMVSGWTAKLMREYAALTKGRLLYEKVKLDP